MEKIEKPLNKSYRPSYFYKKDLLFFENIIKENKGRFEIKTSDYKFNSIEELLNSSDGVPPKEIRFVSYSPYFEMNISQRETNLYSSNSDILSGGIFLRLDNYIKKRAKLGKFSFLFSWGFILAFCTFLGIFPHIFEFEIKYIIVIAVLGFSMYGLVGYTLLASHSQISFGHEGSMSTFWEKNKDQIIVQLFITIISFVMGYFFGKK